jgi:polyhydroxyalkanoate synthesis regulator phasin
MESALHHLNVPTQKDLKALSTKVDALNRKIDGMHPVARRTRKVA